MYPYQIVDAHCDTVAQIEGPTRLKQSAGHLDLPRMQQYQSWLQFFAVWADAADGVVAQERTAQAVISHFYDEMEENKAQIAPVVTLAQALAAWEQGKAAALLAIEGADYIDSLEKLRAYYDKGVRCITLTWNNSNCIAAGAGEKRPRMGLTQYGRTFVREMNALGMIVDVSHASEQTFWDTVETSRAPIIASHSNAAAVCKHRRNLTDAQFTALCDMGGVAGINYYPEFVDKSGRAAVSSLVRHIEHFMALGGENHIGLGGDFDGIGSTPIDLCGVQDVYKLLDALLARNYTEEQVKKIAGGNFLRLIGEVLK